VSELFGRRFVVRCSVLIGSKVVMSNVVGRVVLVSLVVPGMVPPRATVAGGLTLVVGTESGSPLFWTLLALASWGFGLAFGTSSSKVVANVGWVPVTVVVPGMLPPRHPTLLVPRLMTPDPCGPWPIVVGIPAPLTFPPLTSTVWVPVLIVLVVVLIVLVVPVLLSSPLWHTVPVRMTVLEMVPPVVGMVLVRPWLLVPGV